MSGAGGDVVPVVVVADWPIVGRTQDFLVCKESLFVAAVNANNIFRQPSYMKADENNLILVPRCFQELVS